MFDVVVVGNGMFGSAAGRHLAEAGLAVCIVGAPTAPATNDASWRVYSSHDDAARLTRLQDRNPQWAAVTRSAVANYRSIEEASGVTFYQPVGCLIVSRPGGDGRNVDPLEIMTRTDIKFDYFDPGDRTWHDRWPDLEFPATHYVAFEPAPAGYIQPKGLIEAQNVLARAAGADIRTDTVIDITSIDGGRGYHLTTGSGTVIEATRVVVAAGAFTNFNNLLDGLLSPTEGDSGLLDLDLKSEVIILGRVSESDAARLSTMPTVKFLNDDHGATEGLEAIYMVPPVRYLDGNYYIKMGANTRLDQHLTSLPDIQEWFESNADADYLPLLEPALRSLWPAVDFLSVRTKTCVITYTPSRNPTIEKVGERLFVATGGNGGGAKGSDVWGERLAELVVADIG